MTTKTNNNTNNTVAVEVEYDINYTGGEYFGSGRTKLIFIPQDILCRDEESSVHNYFEKATGLSPIHIVYYQVIDDQDYNNIAKFIQTISIVDPETNLPTDMYLYKHPNGGIFAIESAFVEKNANRCIDSSIQDPLELSGRITLDNDYSY